MQSSSVATRPPEPTLTIAAAAAELANRLGHEGIALRYGAATVRVRSPMPVFAAQLARVYGNFALEPPAPFSDLHVDVLPAKRWRVGHRQAVLEVDHQRPFEPFAIDGALPLFEWGVNWYVAQRLHQHLLLHAGVVARGSDAILMAAPPGSGKSTLTAELSLAGFRLLSDEFGVMSLGTALARPMLKPVALKNGAIDVIRERHPTAVLGPVFMKTRKGDVAHLAPDTGSVEAVGEPATVRAIVFPRWEADAPVATRAVSPTEAFARLGFNCFNYAIRGPEAFDTLSALVAAAPATELRYSNLDDAVRLAHALLGTQ